MVLTSTPGGSRLVPSAVGGEYPLSGIRRGKSSMLLVILAFVGLVAVLGTIPPAPAQARRRSRRG